MNAYSVGSRKGRHRTDCLGPEITIFDGVASQFSDESLAGRPEQERQAEASAEPIGVGDQLEVVLESLAEAEARVDDEVSGRHACRARQPRIAGSWQPTFGQ